MSTHVTKPGVSESILLDKASILLDKAWERKNNVSSPYRNCDRDRTGLRLAFTVPGKPQGKARARICTDKKGHTRSYTPEKTAQYEELIRVMYKQAHGTFQFDDKIPLFLSIVAIFPLPKSATKKEKADMTNRVLLPIKIPDTDNIIKIVADALNGVAYRDDAQIVRVEASKFYGEKPRLFIRIEEEKVINKSEDEI